jgi:hypothetical protein
MRFWYGVLFRRWNPGLTDGFIHGDAGDFSCSNAKYGRDVENSLRIGVVFEDDK